MQSARLVPSTLVEPSGLILLLRPLLLTRLGIRRRLVRLQPLVIALHPLIVLGVVPVERHLVLDTLTPRRTYAEYTRGHPAPTALHR